MEDHLDDMTTSDGWSGPGLGARRRLSRAVWVELVARQRGSGLSAAEFCRGEGIPLEAFYRWRQRLGRGSVSAGKDFVQLKAAASASLPKSAPAQNMIEVRFRCGALLRCPTEQLAQLVRLLVDQPQEGDRC